MYRALYRKGLTLEAALSAMAEQPQSHPEAAADISLLRDFIAASRRGIAR